MSSRSQAGKRTAPDLYIDRVLDAVFGRYVDAARLRRALVAHRDEVLVGLLTVAALVLRFYHLGVESFWFDEADIVAQAHAPATTILTSFTQAGANGPLYTLLLHFWIMAVGTSEAAVRLLPMIFGTTTIPLMYLTGRRLFTPTLGLLGAFLLTISPFHIWHSQDAKMYTLVIFVTLLSTLLYVVALEHDEARWWAAYVLVTWVALYAHILAGLILLAHLAITPLLLRRARDHQTAPGAAIPNPKSKIGRRLVIAWAVLLLPLLPLSWDRAVALVNGNIVGGWHSPISLNDMLGVLFIHFAVNRADPPWETLGTWWMGGLFLLGLWPVVALLRRRTPTSARPPLSDTWAALLLLWAVPIGFFWLATLRVPLFEPRYMIIVLPFYLFFVAGGLLRLGAWHRLLPLLGLFGLLVPTVAALAQVNYGPYGQKENWREAVDFVRQHERLRDVVLVYPGYLVTAVDYYRNAEDLSTVPVRTIPQLDTANFGSREFDAALMGAITDHERAWLIESPPRSEAEDPQNRVLHWFQYNWHQFEQRTYNGVVVYGFSFNGQPGSWFPEPTHPQSVLFPNGLAFVGYIYELRNSAPAAQNASWLPLTLYWRTTVALSTDYTFLIELLDANGQVRVRDGPLGPLQGYWPSSQWPANVDLIDYRDVFLPGDLAPGTYHVRVTVLPKAQPDQPLLRADGSASFLLDTPITVRPWQGVSAK